MFLFGRLRPSKRNTVRAEWSAESPPAHRHLLAALPTCDQPRDIGDGDHEEQESENSRTAIGELAKMRSMKSMYFSKLLKTYSEEVG
jgi:hypothetical protein